MNENLKSKKSSHIYLCERSIRVYNLHKQSTTITHMYINTTLGNSLMNVATNNHNNSSEHGECLHVFS